MRHVFLSLLTLLGAMTTVSAADLPERAPRRPVQQAEVRAGGLERVLVEELKPNYLAAANRANAPLLALLRDMGMALGPNVFVRQSEALRTRADLTPTLAALDVPVLLLTRPRACGGGAGSTVTASVGELKVSAPASVRWVHATASPAAMTP